MSEYAIEDQGVGLDDGGGYTGDEGDYSALGYEDPGQDGGAEPGFAWPPAEDGFDDVREALGLVGLDERRFNEYLESTVAPAIAPVAEGVAAWQDQQAADQATATFLDYVGERLEGVNVPEDKYDEAPEAIYEEAVQLYGPERDQIVHEFASKLAQEGVTEIPAEQLDEIIATIDWQAWTTATDSAISGWVRSIDPATGVPKNYSVAARMAEHGPLPSTVQAFREAGWTPEQITPRSPREAVLANDTRRFQSIPGSTKSDYRKGASVTARLFGSEL
jgi:hypothetical protein